MEYEIMSKKLLQRKNRIRAFGVALITMPLMFGCVQQRVFNNGPQITQDQLDLIPVGSSQEQVLLALGSPSTKGQFGTEVFYYISQKRAKTYEFQRMKLIDQKVLSVYFDDQKQVNRVANFGLKDGKVFDFISRTTPTGGREFTFLRQILTGKATPASVATTDRPQGGIPGQGGF